MPANPAHTLPLLRILGIGSPAGDDQVGWQVVEQVASNIEALDYPRQDWEVLSLDRPGLALVDIIATSPALILVDALHMPAERGRIFSLSAQQLTDQTGHCSSHSAGVAEALAMALQLGCMPRQLQILGIGIGPVSMLQESLSPEILAAVKPAAAEVLKLAQRWLQPIINRLESA